MDQSNQVYSIGIDIGYSSVKIVLLNGKNEIKYNKYSMHKGKVRDILKEMIGELLASFDLEKIELGAITGSGGKFLNKTIDIKFVNEVAAIVAGSLLVNKSGMSVIEIGGESAKYITGLNVYDRSQIEISMNSSCSSGTGAFLEEQMSRLDLKLKDYSVYSSRAKTIPRIAGRCSVFAKTDIIHHQQGGVPVEDILLGLAYAVVRNYKGAVMKKLPRKKPLLFIGGVAHNQGIITALKDVLNLTEEELIVPQYFDSIGAIGAAAIANKDSIKIDLKKLLNNIVNLNEDLGYINNEIKLPGLKPFGKNDSINKHNIRCIDNHKIKTDCYLGIDIGSTSTNLVLIDKKNEIIFYSYLRTLGNPVESTRKGLKELKEELGERINIIGAATTGSGRYMIGEFIGADIVKDEITAQARAALSIDGSVDTIIEIGGQDSKYISLKDGIVTDFQMNKICAAGTGSFIEEQANKFNIPVFKFGDLALAGESPINLGERCTVFIETSVAAYLSREAKIEDIVSGLCYSVAKNYLGRVVGQKKIGNKIFFQGGLAYNQGVINAFRALTGKDIIVPPFFSVTGAYGAAILAREEKEGNKTRFRGFDIEPGEFIEKYREKKPETDNKSKFNDKVRKLIFEGYDGSVDHKKETVGIPRALFTYGMFSMFNSFFRDLGFNVLLSDPTSEETIKLGQQYALDETCYPVKLITGHVAELVGKKVDYIFFPDLFTVDHPDSKSRKNYGCAYMQLAYKVVNQAMGLERKKIKLLAPTIAFSLGKEFIMRSFLSVGEQLGKDPEQTKRALKEGMKAFSRLEKRMGENGKLAIRELKPDEKAFVIVSKIYGIADPVLNMGIPGKLMDMGYKVLPFYNIPEWNISKEHPNMFWPFGQHILEPAQIVRHHPNLYAILLTHHGCGPDSIVSHYFREEMDGKPYLHIEVDEHSSGTGVITRVEAFINSLKKVKVKRASNIKTYTDNIVHQEVNIKKSLNELKTNKTILYLQYMYPYSEIFKEMLMSKGINTRVLPETSSASVNIGRKFTIAEEYFSLTAFLGDVFKELYKIGESEKDNIAILVPQNEGTETDGQYSRLLRTKLDEEGFKTVDIVSPFIEDVLYENENDVKLTSFGLLAGDLIRIAPKRFRKGYLARIISLIKTGKSSIEKLISLSEEIHKRVKTENTNKIVLATGEVSVLFNDFINNFTFSNLESEGHRVIYSPLSEALWMMWRDYIDQNKDDRDTLLFRKRLDGLKGDISTISGVLSDVSPFEVNLDNLVKMANRTLGYYSGANGRYRGAKVLGDLHGIDGVITVASIYENTNIVLSILHKGFKKGNAKPVLNLTFDGNINENDKTKIDSFIYFLRQ